MIKHIFVQSQFEAFHSWPSAPEEVGFLRHSHRHLFHVKVFVPVQKNDREVEFFMFKRRLDHFLTRWRGSISNLSCEDFAERILNEFKEASSVEVSEDGENGAVVSKSY